MADMDVDEVKAKLAEEICELLDRHIVGSMSTAHPEMLGRAQEAATAWADDLNAQSLEVRVRALNYLTGRTATGIADLRFECTVNPSPRSDEPMFVMNVVATVKYERPAEAIMVRFTKEHPTPVMCSVCGLTQGDPQANHRPKNMQGFGPQVREDGYYPHVFAPEDPDA